MRSKLLINSSILSSVFLFNHSISAQVEDKDCFNGKTTNYNGKQSITSSGKKCQVWYQANNSSRTMPDSEEDKMSNYCRNPRGDVNGPWCYIDHQPGEPNHEYCGIQTCKGFFDRTQIIFGEYDPVSKQSRLKAMFAHVEQSKKMQNDPILKEKGFNHVLEFFNTDPTGELAENNVEAVDFSDLGGHEFWAMAADEANDRIIIADYYQARILTFNIKSKQLDLALEHVASNIESLAVDWMTQNIYWTDSVLKAIVISSSDFRHYNMINLIEIPQHIVVEPKHGKLIYSSYTEDSKGIKKYSLTMCSMTADPDTCQVVKAFPEIQKITALYIDYHADDDPRLFYADEIGENAFVLSVPVDAEKIKNREHQHLHMQERRSTLSTIATYEGWLYAADQTAKIIPDPKDPSGVAEIQRHKLFIGHAQNPHTSDHTFVLNETISSYGFKGRIQSIVIYDEQDKEELRNLYNNPCLNQDGSPKCPMLCVITDDKITKPFECQCSVGLEVKNPDVKNPADAVCEDAEINYNNGYFLFTDQGITQANDRLQVPVIMEKFEEFNQNKLRKFGFLGGNAVGQYFNQNNQINSMTVQPGENHLYWSFTTTDESGNIEAESIAKLNLDDINSPPEIVITGDEAYASLMEVDPLTGNIYWIHKDNFDIYMSNPQHADKAYRIVEKGRNSVMLDFTIDPINHHIYWSEYVIKPTASGVTSMDDAGACRLMRSNLDGTNPVQIVTDFSNVGALDFEMMTEKLYLVESEFGFFYEFDLSVFNSVYNSQPIQIHDVDAPLDFEMYGIKLYTTGATYQFDAVNKNLHTAGDSIRGLIFIDLIRIDMDKLYFVDALNGSKLIVIDLSKDVSEPKAVPYSANVFYQMTNLHIYNPTVQEMRKELTENIIAQGNFTANCIQCLEQDKICIPDEDKGHCFVPSDSNIDRQAPYHIDTCPVDEQYKLPECQKTVYVNVTNPHFVDNKDSPDDIMVVFTQSGFSGMSVSPSEYGHQRSISVGAGTTINTWEATDQSDNREICMQTIEVVSMGCPSFAEHIDRQIIQQIDPLWSMHYTYTEETCPGLEGSTVNITCSDINKVMKTKTLMNLGSENGVQKNEWEVDMLEAKCVDGNWLNPFISKNFEYRCVLRNETELFKDIIDPRMNNHEEEENHHSESEADYETELENDENRRQEEEDELENELAGDFNSDKSKEDLEETDQDIVKESKKKSSSTAAIIFILLFVVILGFFAYNRYKARIMNGFRNGMGSEMGGKTNQAYAAM